MQWGINLGTPSIPTYALPIAFTTLVFTLSVAQPSGSGNDEFIGISADLDKIYLKRSPQNIDLYWIAMGI